MELTCIVCPLGCKIRIEEENKVIRIEGNGCKRGENYAWEEMTDPRRVLTAVVTVHDSSRMLSVKTTKPIKKEHIISAMEEIKEIIVRKPIKIGQIICSDLAGTGVALVSTKELE